MKDLISGILFIFFGALFLYTSIDYPMGELDQIGPGFWPTSIATLLMVIGVTIILTKK